MNGTKIRNQITEVINNSIVRKYGKPVASDEPEMFKVEKYRREESYDKKFCAGSRFCFVQWPHISSDIILCIKHFLRTNTFPANKNISSEHFPSNISSEYIAQIKHVQ